MRIIQRGTESCYHAGAAPSLVRIEGLRLESKPARIIAQKDLSENLQVEFAPIQPVRFFVARKCLI